MANLTEIAPASGRRTERNVAVLALARLLCWALLAAAPLLGALAAAESRSPNRSGKNFNKSVDGEARAR